MLYKTVKWQWKRRIAVSSMIQLLTPALTLRLEQLGVRKEYLATAAGFLIRCWSGNNCLGAYTYIQLCRNDPLCKYIKYVLENDDKEGALRALSWFVVCSGKRLIKNIDIRGRVVSYDYTEEFLKKHPPPAVDCEVKV